MVEMLESAPILKFGFLYLTPSVAWICATVSSGGTASFVWTFGQESNPIATLSIHTSHALSRFFLSLCQ